MLGALAALSGCGGVRLHGMRQRVGFAVVNTRLLLHGEITRRTPVEFAQVLAQNPQITTVVLQDLTGGEDPAAMVALARDLRGRGLETALQSDSNVSGPAVALFLAGQQRRMVRGAVLTLSDWEDVPRGFVNEMLGAYAFDLFALRVTAGGAVHHMTEAELEQFGLLTAPVTVWN